MNQIKTLGETVKRLAFAAVLASFAAAGFSFSTVNPELSVQQMSKEADEIVVGNVVAQNVRIVGNTFETDYDIQVNENLKSTLGELPPGKSFTLTLPGGSIQEPPLGQYVMGTPYMFKGEEVLLFLRKGSGKEARLPKDAVNAGQVTKLSSSFQVVGFNQGRFDVIAHPETGERMVMRLNLENFGVMGNSAAVEQAVKAAAQNQIPLIEAEVARKTDAAAEARDKDPLEFTASDGKKIKVEQRMQNAQSMKNQRQRGLSVQSLDEFKDQIKASANTY